MSDYFMPTKRNDYFSKYENKDNTQNQNSQTDYWQNQSQKTMEQKQAQLDNRERYGVNVPDEYYDTFNKIISQAESPEKAQEEAYKIGSAVRYSQMMNIPLEEAYKNVDALNEAQFPDKADQKGRFEAISDMFTLGKNNVTLGELGQKLMKAHRENDTELAQALMTEIDAINQQNQLMQDNAPRSWVMQALEAGAQSLPFTGAVAGAGIIGNFIAPAVGTGASFAASSYLSAGTEYIDMLANGASPETARAVAMVSGGIQGLIEADLGITKGIVKGAARIAGKEVAESTAKRGLEEIGRKVFKRFHFGAGKKVLINYLENRGKDILGEGTEEFLQEITSIVGQEVAASLDGYDIPENDFKHIVKQTTEAFRGGVLGALSMGFIPAGLNAAADVKSFKAIKDGAEVIESEEVFKEAVKDNPVFEGMSDQQKTETIHDVWQNAQNRKEEAINLEAQKIAEGRDAGEGAEEAPEENEDGTTDVQAVARNEAGRLYTSDDVSTDDDGNVTGGTFVIGDKTKSENNRYGYITYSTAENGDITIESFKMTKGREGLRNEAFDEFAREHPDVNIEWNAIGSESQDFKDALVEANPSGAKNGLNYYSSNELDNIAARKQVADEVRKNIHNVKRNADGSFTRTELSNKQVAAAVTLIESAARRMNMGLSEYVNKTFGNQIFGSREEFTQATLAQGENVNTKAGGMTQGVAQANWREVGQQIKAVIYAGENADFSTWTHEMAHVFQNQLDGELKNKAEAAFNVVGGDWTHSTYTFSDGRTMSSAEAFAYGFQDWLETGKAESEQMKNIFQKFAEFIADAYNRLRKHLDFTPEIESVFNKLLDGDDTIMSKALKAAQEQEGEYRANLKRQAEEKQVQQKAEAEQKKAQAQAEREEASETTDFEESAPDAESVIKEVTNEKEPETDAIDNALKDLPLTDEEKNQISDTLRDETSSIIEKAEAATEAASSVYDEEDSEIPDDMFFQNTPEEIEAADKYLDTFKSAEKKRIKQNFEKFKDTPWYNSTIKSLNARNDINALLDGKELPADSVLKQSFLKTYYDVLTGGDTREERINNLYEYFDCMSSLIGHPSKPINSVASSFVNCNPSKECAQFCYAATGRNQMLNLIVNRELVNWCIEHDPARSARMVADEYKVTREYKNGVALRLLDTGDLSEPWLDFIKELNDRGISCQIFSKRPDLLKQVDREKNVILLSIDNSNTDVAKKYPDMPIAYVYSGAHDLEYIKNSEERFKQYSGVILPVVMNRKRLSEKDIKALPSWTRNYTCPIDAGWKEIGNNQERKYNTDKWNCSVCDINGQGCFFARAVKDRKKFYATLKEVPIGVLNAITEEYEKLAATKLAALGLSESDIGSILKEMVNIRDQKLAGIDTEGTNTGLYGNGGILQKAPGQTESLESKNGSKKESAVKDGLLYQEVAEAGNAMQLAVNSSYDEYANEEIKTKAEAILDTKIRENTGVSRDSTRVWSIYRELKLHKGSEVVGKKIEVDSSARPTEAGWNQLREILDIFRNKSFETFRYVLINQNGEIKKQYAVSAKVPGSSPIVPGVTKDEQQAYINRIANEALFSDCKIVFVHNHPSGNIRQSPEDESVTRFLRSVPELYLGHMILDHNKYNLNIGSDASESVWTEHEISGNEKDALLKQPKKHKNVFNQKIKDWSDLDTVAGKLNNVDAGTIPVCFATNAMRISSIAYIPEDLFTVDNLQELRKNLEGTALKAGTLYTYAVTNNPDVLDFINQNNNVLRFCDAVLKQSDGTKNSHLKNAGNAFFNHANDVAQETLFQEAFHGSGADFDKFDTENYGLSGEGSMSFGYGTYVTDDEEIARDYANRGGKVNYHYFYKGNEETEATSPKLLASATYNHYGSIEEAIKNLEELIVITTDDYSKAYYQSGIDILKESKPEDFKTEIETTRHLYTVDIPDNGYIVWDKDVDAKTKKFVEDAVFEKLTTEPNEDGEYVYKGAERELREELNSTFGADIDGEALYNDVVVYLGDEKTASKFLNKLGFVGINYPAYTNFGNAMGKTARNFVIFNDDDAQIVNKLLFQTQAELMDEARGFDTWQEFMEFCEFMHADDDVSPIPGDADAQWYQSFWETSKGVQTEQEKNEEAVQARSNKMTQVPAALDALFTTYIKSVPEMVDNFLHAVAEIDAMDLDSEEWQQAENAEDAAQREKIEQLKDFISITLSDYNWQTALKRIQGGHEISEGLRKRLVGEMTDNFKARDFRALYAEVMGDEQYAVAEEDSITAVLNKKLKKYHDIVKPNDDIARWSPEKRKQLAEQLQNREIAAKIKSGSLKLDDELDAYIKSLQKQIKDKQKQFDELEAETKADYQRIADKEKRDLLKLHEQLLIARSKLKSRNAEIDRKIAKGLKITKKYGEWTQNMNANYNEIFRKYSDLRNTITINAEVQAALDRQEKIAGLREDLNAKQKEKNLTAEIKKMRIQLVKRTMRRVPFNRIDFNNAKTVIAIQRMLEPNLLGGVNRFIGIDSAYLRGVISQIVTDSEYREKIMHYLNKTSKASQAFADFKKKLEELKTIKDFDSWTAKDRKAAIRYLPKENWVRDLNLLQLAKEREESMDLDIGMEEVKRQVYDEKTGEPKTYKDKEGNEHNVTETAFRLKYDEEIGKLVQDAVGADMFDKIVNMPFSEWTTEDLEGLAQRIDEIYTEGRDLKAAKDEARKREANAIRKRIEDAIKETGITFNDDDTPEEIERKQKKIDKILGKNSDLMGTEAGKDKGIGAKLNRLLHGYVDMNVLRFARMLDGQSEGENVRMLYRREDDCYNAKQRSMDSRASTIYKVMSDNKITEGDLAKVVKVPSLGTEFTVDELLYFLAADKDYVEDEKKLQKGEIGIDANDDYAATSRNAVMFGNMMSDMLSQEEKEAWNQLDKDLEEALKNDTLTQEQKEELATGRLDKRPGTTRYIAACHAKWEAVLSVANNYLSTHPEYKALMEAIEADYASQYERMNEVSITEFNQPVHRVKAYVPLVRRESNGDTNEAQVKEDLLGAAGVGKQWADKGMTQRRVQISPLNQKPVQTGLFRTWGDSIERTEHFIAYAPYVRQLNAVYKSRDAAYTRRYIESRYGKGAIQYLDEYINEVANPNAGRIREKGAELLHVLRGKTAPAYLGWKASGIIKQGLTSPWPYMQFVNSAEYLSAAMKFTFNPEMRDAISEKSIYMKLRRMDPVNDLIDEMADNAKNKVDRAWSKFSQIGMQGLEMIDWACVAPGWLACYEKKYNQLQRSSEARYQAKMAELKERNMYADIGTSEYLSPQQMEAEARKEITEDIETEAVRYADDCTRACQPSNRVTDLAPLFKNSSEAMKAFLQFQTSLNVIWQNIRYDLPYAVKQREFKRIAGTVIGYVCAGIFMNSVMDGIGGDDDDDMQALRNLIYYSTTQFTDAIPIMGSEITNAMDKIITGKRAYSQSGTDMTPSATKLLNALQKATSGDWDKAASLTAEGIGLLMGAPVSGVKEINKLLGKPLTNGDVDLLRGLSDVYGIAGDIIE